MSLQDVHHGQLPALAGPRGPPCREAAATGGVLSPRDLRDRLHHPCVRNPYAISGKVVTSLQIEETRLKEQLKDWGFNIEYSQQARRNCRDTLF